MPYGLIVGSIMLGLLIAMMNGLLGKLCAMQGPLKATVRYVVGMGAVCSAMLPTMFAFLMPDNPFPAYQLWGMFMIMFACSLAFLPFVMRGGYKVAANHLRQVKATVAYATLNFDALSEGEGEAKVITEDSLNSVLRRATITDDERKFVSYLRSNLNAVGHKAAVERSFAIRVDTSVGEYEQTTDLYALNRADLLAWEGKVREQHQGWITD